MAGLTRLELATFRVTGERSNQTELQPRIFKRTIFMMVCGVTIRNLLRSSVMYGSLDWTRTSDLTINSRLLYQLSYQGTTIIGTIILLKINGGRYWIRTSDPQFVRLMLYQLS